MPDGILIVDKPEGWTSHDVVARVRRLLGERSVGHTGTLDPFATGVLVVLLGRATRLAQFVNGAEKEYEALIRFGYATETGDLTGAPRPPSPNEAMSGDTLSSHADFDCAALSEDRIEAALCTLRGEIEQIPPMYSAKKVQGKKLYEFARRGVEVERKAVRVTIREFEVLRRGDKELLRRNDDGTCDLRARIVCSAGTYVRVVAESLGENLGVGAHLAALRRTRAGSFRIEEAHRLEEFDGKMDEAGASPEKLPFSEKLLSMETALSAMPAVHLTDAEAQRARHGAPVRVSANTAADRAEGEHVRMLNEAGELIAVGVYGASSSQIRTRVLLVPQGK
jgi:tRNA pseudouridine55 synthase